MTFVLFYLCMGKNLVGDGHGCCGGRGGLVNNVMEEVNKKQVKEFNEGLVKVYLCKVKQIKMEVVMNVVVDEVVDKEVTKVVEQVNKELVKEVNEGFVLVDVVMVIEAVEASHVPLMRRLKKKLFSYSVISNLQKTEEKSQPIPASLH